MSIVSQSLALDKYREPKLWARWVSWAKALRSISIVAGAVVAWCDWSRWPQSMVACLASHILTLGILAASRPYRRRDKKTFDRINPTLSFKLDNLIPSAALRSTDRIIMPSAYSEAPITTYNYKMLCPTGSPPYKFRHTATNLNCRTRSQTLT